MSAMNKKKKIKVLIVQLVVLVVAIIATLFWISAEKKEVTVYDYSRTIQFNDKSNYQLTANDLTPVQLMAADIKPEYVVNQQDVIGKYITGDVFKGTHVMSTQLSSDPPYINNTSADAEAELRKIAIPISYATALAGNIKAGDVVDLMFLDNNAGLATSDTEKATSEEKGTVTYASARIFMQDLSVYQVYTKDGAVYERRESDPATLGLYNGELANGGSVGNEEEEKNYDAPAYVILAVTAPQFEEITARLQMGTISIVGRFGGSQDQQTNGYLVAKGDTAEIYVGQGTLEKDIELFDASQPITQITNDLPKLYTFIRNLSKVQMTDDQRQRYASVYTKYSDYMTAMYGTNWESNNPDAVTMDAIAAYVGTDDSAVTIFMQFKSDLETLAKELRGNQVVLPW